MLAVVGDDRGLYNILMNMLPILKYSIDNWDPVRLCHNILANLMIFFLYLS